MINYHHKITFRGIAMKKSIVVLAIVVILSVFAGCGSKPAEVPAQVTPAPAEATSVPLPPTPTPAEEIPEDAECKVVIEKQPTDEHLTEGGTAIFIAKATGADSVRWMVTDPTQVHQYDKKALLEHFPGLEVEGETTETFKLINVPDEMDGFRVSAIFSDKYGEVQTGLANVYSANFFTQIPHYYEFCSGAGAWRTVMKINDDGSFEGHFLDSDYDAVYESRFTGSFGTIKKIDGYSYSMELLSLDYDKSGKEYVSDYGQKVKAVEPYGLEGGKEFIVYLPGIPATDLPEGFIPWAHLTGDSFEGYGIYNKIAETGFVNCDEYTYNANK